MISTVYFYKTGLNERNFAYDKTAHNNILANAQAEQGGEIKIILSAPLAFGQVFNIDVAQYLNVYLCTYIKIVNDYGNDTTETRFAFINNFMSLANGNYAVAYELDDWTNFILSGNYTYHIDGFTQRANVKLLSNDNKIDYSYASDYNRKDHNNKYTIRKPENRLLVGGQALPDGWSCGVYFMDKLSHAGTALQYAFTGTYTDYNVEERRQNIIEKNNSSLAFLIFDENGISINFRGLTPSGAGYVFYGGGFNRSEINGDNIQKILYFDFFPSMDPIDIKQVINNVDITEWVVDVAADGSPWSAIGGVTGYASANTTDIGYILTSNRWAQAYKLNNFAPICQYSLNNITEIKPSGSNFEKKQNYDAYITSSLYAETAVAKNIKIKYSGAELFIPQNLINTLTVFYAGVSGDGESSFIKTKNTNEQGSFNQLISTAQNQGAVDLTITRDWRSYKNAKITGTAALIATAAGGVVSVGASVASQNVAGIVGGISGTAQGIISAAQRLDGLTSMRQSQSNNDYTLNEISGIVGFYVEITETLGELRLNEIIDFEKNGIYTFIEFNEYLNTQRMQAFNAIQTSDLDINGIPQQAARRISETFAAGVTLWTAPDVGNKDVINYPL